MPLRGGRSEAPPSPGLLVLYLPYAVVVSIPHIDFIVTVIIGFNYGDAVGFFKPRRCGGTIRGTLCTTSAKVVTSLTSELVSFLV